MQDVMVSVNIEKQQERIMRLWQGGKSQVNLARFICECEIILSGNREYITILR